MNKVSMRLSPSARLGLGGLLLSLGLASAQGQSNDPSVGNFGDRQSGHWGDPGAGHFGNPAAGQFDNAGVKVPPVGTRPLGKLYDQNKKLIEPSPYISLPAPTDKVVKAETPKTKRPAKKRAAKKDVGN